jgi:hypothetical protein
MKKLLTVTGLMLVVFAGTAVAADALKSGPQAGEKVPGPFEPLNINGEAANQKNCLFCQYGQSPVAMVFAREVTPEVKALIAKLDACTEANKGCDMGGCVIFCSDAKGLEKQLQELAKDAKLKSCILAIENQAGPEEYKIAKDADVTVLVYKSRVVKANFAFKKGEFKEKDIEKILAEVAKLTTK